MLSLTGGSRGGEEAERIKTDESVTGFLWACVHTVDKLTIFSLLGKGVKEKS